MKIAICDDVKADREELKAALFKFEKEKNIEFTILEYSTPKSLYSDCKAREELQIVFFDVYMGDILGTDAAKKMRELGYKGSIIFCTTSEEHALEGFRVQADGYLVKPYSYEEFKEAIVRLESLFQNEQKRIVFTSGISTPSLYKSTTNINLISPSTSRFFALFLSSSEESPVRNIEGILCSLK